MLNGVAGGELLAQLGAVAVAAVAGSLVYRDASYHGNYHALSASAAVTLAGLVGFAVGGLVGLFVGTGYVLLLYLLSYPTTPSVDPEEPALDGRPKGDAGESLCGDDDVVSVIRVEVAGYETLRELARRYDDIPNTGTEAELRSALRVKALSHVRREIDGETDDCRSDAGIRSWSEPNAPTSAGIEEWSARMPPAESDTEVAVSEWSSDNPPAESEVSFDAGDWTAAAENPNERVGDYDAAGWSDDGSADTGESDERNGDGGVWTTAGAETEQPSTDHGGMVFDNAVERAAECETQAQQVDTPAPEAQDEPVGDGDPFDGRGELYDGDGNAP